jgi:hypothetical protein
MYLQAGLRDGTRSNILLFQAISERHLHIPIQNNSRKNLKPCVTSIPRKFFETSMEES